MPKKKTTEQFIEEARKVHGDKYDYTESSYKGVKEEIYIICPKHGGFWQRADKHLIGHDCRDCAEESRIKTRTIPLRKRIELINESCERKNITFLGFCTRNGEKCEYESYTTHLHLKCNICGHEWTSSNYDNFLHKDTKCIRCQVNKRNDFNSYSEEEAIKKINKKLVKGVEFLYFCDYNGEKIEYRRGKETQVKLRCDKCGNTWITPFVSFSSYCPICHLYKLENQIMLLFDENNIKFEMHKHFQWLSKQSVDFFLPQYNVAIECQGIQHFESIDFAGKGEEWAKEIFKHTIERDERKRKLCEENGIKLLYYSNLGIDYPYEVYEDKTKLIKEIYKINEKV